MRGATPRSHSGAASCGEFQSTLLMRGATKQYGIKVMYYDISIHAPHARSDYCNVKHRFMHLAFQSTLLMRGATARQESLQRARGFQSTLLMRGATYLRRRWCANVEISIHAPHARSDGTGKTMLVAIIAFQSTLLMRGATLIQ